MPEPSDHFFCKAPYAPALAHQFLILHLKKKIIDPENTHSIHMDNNEKGKIKDVENFLHTLLTSLSH